MYICIHLWWEFFLYLEFLHNSYNAADNVYGQLIIHLYSIIEAPPYVYSIPMYVYIEFQRLHYFQSENENANVLLSVVFMLILF